MASKIWIKTAFWEIQVRQRLKRGGKYLEDIVEYLYEWAEKQG